MTNAEKALAYIQDPLSVGVDKYAFLEWETRQVIIRALKIAAAVDGDGLEMKERPTWENGDPQLYDENHKGNNDLLERLRGIK